MRPTSYNPYRPDLQGLRAIAVLLVIIAHAGCKRLAGGFIGVDVFFVLSGYLITGLLTHELEETGRIQLVRFYARRLKRLLPALTTMLLLTLTMARWLLSDLEICTQLASGP
jgi:peptidoglycan/LPS O-acetylase OafA/YrhL